MSHGTELMFKHSKLKEALEHVAKHYGLTVDEVKSTLQKQRDNDEWNAGG